jgi:hypothetical protein
MKKPSFLLLEQLWQGLDKIRILTGNETTRATQKVIVQALIKKSEERIELLVEEQGVSYSN